MNRMRIAVVGLALLATACASDKTGGDAKPGSTTAPTTATVGTSSSDATGLVSAKPCELISGQEAARLGLTASPEARKLAGSETCEWIDQNGGLTILLDLKRGAADQDYAGDTKTPANFGKFDGYTVAAPGKSADLCHAVISVTDSSSVQIVGGVKASSTDTAKACELATKSAELVAAKLP